MADLFVDHYAPDLTEGCCTSELYALLFDQSGNALNGSSLPWTMQSYTQAAHDDFVIPLVEDTQRSLYYKATIVEANLTLDPTPIGETYFFEIWRAAVAATYVRDDDTLREVRRCWWDGSYLSYAQLSSGQVDQIAGILAHCSVSYDSNTSTVFFTCWLERNKVLDTSTTNCNILWKDRTGANIISADFDQAYYLPGMDGVFVFGVSPITLTADHTTPLVCTITDANTNDYATLVSVITWD